MKRRGLFLKTITPTEMTQAANSGARPCGRGRVIPSKCLSAQNRPRFWPPVPPKEDRSSRIFENWRVGIEKPGNQPDLSTFASDSCQQRGKPPRTRPASLQCSRSVQPSVVLEEGHHEREGSYAHSVHRKERYLRWGADALLADLVVLTRSRRDRPQPSPPPMEQQAGRERPLMARCADPNEGTPGHPWS